MKNSDVIIAHPNSLDKLQALKEFMHDHQIPFELAVIDTPSKKEFVEMILQGDEDKMNGKGRKISVEELEQLWR
ncbi:MAG: DUF2683 family protein [Saprospiraceae bacterium]